MKISRKRNNGKISRDRIIRAVASSTAIETGEPIAVIEKKLRRKNGKFQDLTLAL
jgi:hypothetical protein